MKNVTTYTIKIQECDNDIDVKELFNALQKLKAIDYLKLYQFMYQDLIEHQQLNYFKEDKTNFKSEVE